MDTIDLKWINRCFDLAVNGIGAVSPNPPVGAVLVYEDRILGEGYHTVYGGPHAEVEAVRSVPADQRHLIPKAILYVSLEPCCITGKTPPCTDLILAEGIRDVRVSAIDPNPTVAGKGLARLQANGVSVKYGIAIEEGQKLIRAFRTNMLKQRPHVILKWAQSKYGISGVPGQQVWFSSPESQIFSHRLRAEYDCILVGARTVATDNPSLTTRKYPGRSPHRVIYDPKGKLGSEYNVFHPDGAKIFYFSAAPIRELMADANFFPIQLSDSQPHARQILLALFQHNIGSLLVEGGAFVHQLFIQENNWDEAWVIQTPNETAEGIRAPNVHGRRLGTLSAGRDTIVGIANDSPG